MQVLFNHVILDKITSDFLLEGFEGQTPGNPVTFTVTNSLGTDLEFASTDDGLTITDTSALTLCCKKKRNNTLLCGHVVISML